MGKYLTQLSTYFSFSGFSKLIEEEPPKEVKLFFSNNYIEKKRIAKAFYAINFNATHNEIKFGYLTMHEDDINCGMCTILAYETDIFTKNRIISEIARINEKCIVNKINSVIRVCIINLSKKPEKYIGWRCDVAFYSVLTNIFPILNNGIIIPNELIHYFDEQEYTIIMDFRKYNSRIFEDKSFISKYSTFFDTLFSQKSFWFDTNHDGRFASHFITSGYIGFDRIGIIPPPESSKQFNNFINNIILKPLEKYNVPIFRLWTRVGFYKETNKKIVKQDIKNIEKLIKYNIKAKYFIDENFDGLYLKTS